MTFEPKGRRIVDMPRMQRPWRFALATAAIVAVAVAVLYAFGLPMLDDSAIWCPRIASRRSGGGCYSHFGVFVTVWISVVTFAEAFVWRKCR
jgi:hypothetical protein